MMNHPLQLFVDALRIDFHHITTYELNAGWRIRNRELRQSVFWYPLDGRIRVSVNGAEYAVGPGELIHLPAGSSLSARPLTAAVTLISINFTAVVSFLPDRPWYELLRFPVALGLAASELSELLRDMTRIAGQAGIARSMLLHAGMTRLVGMLIDLYTSDVPDRSELSPDMRINHIIAYLMSHPSLMPTVSDLAELVQLSESHLRKLFQQHLGLPPHSFIHRVKVEQAKKMLAESGERISDIAVQLGFHDPNYFARLFRQHAALSPKAYRDSHQNWMNGTLSND